MIKQCNHEIGYTRYFEKLFLKCDKCHTILIFDGECILDKTYYVNIILYHEYVSKNICICGKCNKVVGRFRYACVENVGDYLKLNQFAYLQYN